MAVNSGSAVRRTVLQSGLLVGLCLGFGGSAWANTWAVPGDSCAVTIYSEPQIFTYGVGTGYELESVWNNPNWVIQNISHESLRPTQLACAAQPNNQIVVVYRDTSSTLKSVDGTSGWTETVLPGGGSAFGQGLFATQVFDAGKSKIVLFAATYTNTIKMWVWDDTTTPKWSQPVSLATVPGGLSTNVEHRLTGYAVFTGASPYQGIASVFVVSSDGHLRENKGPLTSARNWIDHGVTPDGKAFSPNIQFGPTATALYNSIQGHPDPYFETNWNRRITLPTADNTGIWSRGAVNGAGTFSWTQVAGSSTTPSVGYNLTSGWARGCVNPNQPCGLAQEMIARYSVAGGSKYANFYTAQTASSPAIPSSLTLLPPITTNQTNPVISWASGTIDGFMFYVESSTNMVILNLDTFAVTNVGHP
jgi:hypothetical protein